MHIKASQNSSSLFDYLGINMENSIVVFHMVVVNNDYH